MKIFRLITVICMQAMLHTCGATPDFGTSPGSCALDSCLSAHLASTEMRITFLTDQINLTCNSPTKKGDFPHTVPIQFVVEKPRRILPAEEIETTDGSPTLPTNGDRAQWEPVSGVSFHPLVVDGDGALTGNSILDKDGNPVDMFRGVETSRSEWCTDTCGNGVIHVIPKCPGHGTMGAEYRLQIISGSLNGEVVLNMSSTP